jgi:hypothetical protein
MKHGTMNLKFVALYLLDVLGFNLGSVIVLIELLGVFLIHG